MPTTELPQLFGFHQNADITKNLGQAKELLEVLLSIGQVEGADPADSDEEEGSPRKELSLKKPVKSKLKRTGTKSRLALTKDELIEKTCHLILSQLPKQSFDMESIQTLFPITRENSMNTVLLQEVMRFNQLHGTITKTIE